ncbi:hypothetical protein HPB50_001117 [Hyalomma asiaticum]|uniref:Uncharacterized protein n=1 Tax=Hyalomma asiaticum TaxID=266040 RepID=A0ACB7RX19_HYAAI|nr:hypothetical protein HPB50_001117 [Hyalomma asiaticum]
MATAPCSTDVFEHLDDAAREEAYRSAVSEAAALKTEVDQLRRELELLKMVPSKDHDAANDDDAPKPPLDPQLQASHDFLCNLLTPLIERIERLESRTQILSKAFRLWLRKNARVYPQRSPSNAALTRSVRRGSPGAIVSARRASGRASPPMIK